VVAGSVSDPWRLALTERTSNLHVIDRFSVHCDVKRCAFRDLLAQIEPEAPSLTVNCNVPSLICNLSETKLVSLLRCLSPPQPSSRGPKGGPEPALSKRRLRVDRRLMVANISISSIAVEMYSGHLELERLVGIRVAGVEAEITHRPFDETFKFVVQSVLAQDHTQPPGSEFYKLITTETFEGEPFLKMMYTHLLSAGTPLAKVYT
jgi:hypothetical protein